MKDTIREILPALEKIRKQLHQHPELSQQEHNTAKHIVQYLETHSNADISYVAETGVIAVFDSHKEGKSVLLRADIDALPIVEMNDFDHKSKVVGVSHKCGHDGHTVMMLGVASVLTENPVTNGKVVLLFQPAEEVGMGAEAVLKDAYFKKMSFDFVFALHNIPGYKKNQIILRDHVFNANVKSLIIKLEGKSAHAAEPEKGHNPALAIAEILQYVDTLNHNQPDDHEFFLITPVHIQMGVLAYGVSAGEGELHLTIRSWDLDLFDQKSDQLLNFVKKTCETYKLEASTSWTQVFYANKNNKTANDYIRRAAVKNKFEVHEMTHSFKWGEDFGLFTQKFNGAMFGLGAGENTPALHNPDYDFPDDITATGVQQFYQIIQEINKD